MTEFYRNYLAVAVFIGAALLMVGGDARRRAAAPSDRPRPEKFMPYEAGSDPVGRVRPVERPVLRVRPALRDVRRRGRVHLPVGGPASRRLGVFGLVEMIVFIVILTLGLVYAWRKGVLRWA